MGDVNDEKIDESFKYLYNLKHLIKVSTCYKNPDNPCYRSHVYKLSS